MYRHGIYVSEQETSMIAPLNGTAGLQVVIGTAPVHLLADPAAAINKPLLVYSKAEAIAAVGYSDDFASFHTLRSDLRFVRGGERGPPGADQCAGPGQALPPRWRRRPCRSTAAWPLWRRRACS